MPLPRCYGRRLQRLVERPPEPLESRFDVNHGMLVSVLERVPREEPSGAGYRQLIGEGLCNLGAGLVGGFASSGSFSRTAVNFEAGAVTRVSCVASGVLVALLVLLFAPAANVIPIVLCHPPLRILPASCGM